MNSNTHDQQDAEQDMELRARCPDWMKGSVKAVAAARLVSEADILREAVAEYLERRKQKQEVAA